MPWGFLICSRNHETLLFVCISKSNFIFNKKNFIISLPQISLAAVIDRMCYPGGSGVKNPPAGAGDAGLIPGLGGSPGEESENAIQYSCLGNPKVRGAWLAIVCGVAKESNIA